MKKQSGFSAIEGLIILVTAGIVGFTGWYLWHSKSNADKTLSDTAKMKQASSGNTSRVIYITSKDDGKKTITLHVGQELIFRLDSSTQWKYGSEVIKQEKDQALLDKSNGDFVAQGTGQFVVIAAGGTPPSINCPQNAKCAVPLDNYPTHIHFPVNVVE